MLITAFTDAIIIIRSIHFKPKPIYEMRLVNTEPFVLISTDCFQYLVEGIFQHCPTCFITQVDLALNSIIKFVLHGPRINCIHSNSNEMHSSL